MPACGLPFVVSGGQALAQAPKHVLFAPVSFSNRYSVRPCASMRILPSLVSRTPTTALFVRVGRGGRGGACLDVVVVAVAAAPGDRQGGRRHGQCRGEKYRASAGHRGPFREGVGRTTSRSQGGGRAGSGLWSRYRDGPGAQSAMARLRRPSRSSRPRPAPRRCASMARPRCRVRGGEPGAVALLGVAALAVLRATARPDAIREAKEVTRLAAEQIVAPALRARS